jgi:hypothetical protein
MAIHRLNDLSIILQKRIDARKEKKKKQSADFLLLLCVWRISLRLKRVSEFSYGKVGKTFFSFLKVYRKMVEKCGIFLPDKPQKIR